MLICKQCGTTFPRQTFIGEKQIDCRGRKYCLKCSPFGTRHKCGPRPKYGIRMKGNPFEVSCNLCNKKFITKNAQRTCPTCANKKIRNERKTKAINDKGGKCQRCGYNKCNKALVFHHVDRDKKLFSLSSNWEKSITRVQSELDKCVLLCMNCHHELHAETWKINEIIKGV